MLEHRGYGRAARAGTHFGLRGAVVVAAACDDRAAASELAPALIVGAGAGGLEEEADGAGRGEAGAFASAALAGGGAPSGAARGEGDAQKEECHFGSREDWSRLADVIHPGVKVRLPLERTPSKIYVHAKRLFDIVFSACALVVLSSVFAVCAVAVRVTSEGPVVFRQRRWGRSGETFECYKFRTMLVGSPANVKAAEFGGKQNWITPVGDVMRRWSLDELPQLVNVLKGDMSLIGPRPVIIAEKALIDLRRPLGADQVRPGITGWAQVNGRNLVDDREKAFLDGEYVANMSIAFDARIFFRSLVVIASRKGVDADRSDGEEGGRR